MSGPLERMAGAPITWGVDGSPGWGHLMDRERVLGEMASLGLRATELGPHGYLPTSPGELADLMSRYGLRVVGAFVPVVLYRPGMAEEQLNYLERTVRTLADAGATVAVLAAASDLPGYDSSVELEEREWSVLVANLRRATEIVRGHGLAPALHPHWGMAVERLHHVERVLDATDVGLCVDTGHLALAGTDPIEVAEAARGRVDHVHLKDMDEDLARKVRSGEMAFRRAVIEGLFRPLGEGSVDVAGLVGALEASGYGGWYVLEQDCSLAGPPPPGRGPVEAAARSVEFLRRIVPERAPGVTARVQAVAAGSAVGTSHEERRRDGTT
jgi:inosose dehydratase